LLFTKLINNQLINVYLKSSKLHINVRIFDESRICTMNTKSLFKTRNVRKNVNWFTTTALRQPLIVELDTPDASEYEIHFYEIQKTIITLCRYPKFRRTNCNVQRDAIGRNSNCVWPSHVQICANLCYDNYSLPDSTLPMR